MGRGREGGESLVSGRNCFLSRLLGLNFICMYQVLIFLNLDVLLSTLSHLPSLPNTTIAPSIPSPVHSLPTSSNLLHVSVEHIRINASEPCQTLIASTADRRLNLLNPSSNNDLIKSTTTLQDSPILSCLVLQRNHATITSGMSGQVVLYDHDRDVRLDERRDHSKYVVKVAAWEDADGAWLATAGWDAKVLVYRLRVSSNAAYDSIGPPVASISLSTNPETLLFAVPPNAAVPILVVTRRDSTSLHYYELPSEQDVSMRPSAPSKLELLGSQNLAPHSNAWVAFTPSSIMLCPTDSSLLAVATSALPHVKLIIVRLLFPSPQSPFINAVAPLTQAAQTRNKLAIQDREDAAILVHASTFSPQTPYSTPQIYWRPDGSGVWVNGDDGVLRGLETKTGKVVATLKGGHDMGSKIRSIWAGWIGEKEKRKECIVSGGFDRRLIVWGVANESDDSTGRVT